MNDMHLHQRCVKGDGESARHPDFLCIGAQKAGTTTLHDLLQRHPDAFVPEVKETHYFSLHFDQPLAWYERHFAAARPAQIVGEITPYYLFHPAAAARIAGQLPTARLIVLLRDPVERALSGYFHAKRHGMEPLPIDEAFASEADRLRDAERQLDAPGTRHTAHQWHSYVARSRYDVQLAGYLALFPASRLLMVQSEEFFTTPKPIWDRIQAFLGLRPVHLPHTLPHANRGRGELATVAPHLRQRLREWLEPTYHVLQQEYGIAWPPVAVANEHHAT
jgi:hypothetical protein